MSRARRTGRHGRADFPLLDLVVAGVLLVVVAPLLLIVAVLVRTTSAGPALFRQERLGRGQVPFTMLKFRSMRVDADDAPHREYVTAMLSRGSAGSEQAGGVFKLVDDPRVTRLGSFLRRTSLDELPQLINVLRGEMALVGPRPVLAWEAAQFPAWADARFMVKPGLTGLWQVEARSAVGMLEALNMDVRYVRERCWRLDVTLLLRTALVLLGRSVAR